ncbi:MAG TPA: HAD-IG family 5'-nucleotidase [Oligoflexus sp.]|uniref:HAD-IG family 5'-nucleotidase n=1 Tax=Oligoflexus sp. TaxID=1971216 RepID=UPI002D491D55|nr:HAD-IG family 5'-nucleotidase [Oligoflexus sp.]HYX33096.1 HAD-IG family 5'-nucleotidase [Oligoflexus sp.]
MQKLKKHQKIYVNRSLNMASIKSIGFDMDHTLVLYNRENFESLAFHETVKKFVQNGYPEELLKLKFDPDFVIRGLLVDRDRGNLLKVDSHKYVKVAFHGHRKLDKQERYELYNAKSYKADDYLTVDTFFAQSEVQLFTEIVDYMRRHPGQIQKSYRQVYSDLREWIDLSHQDGSIKLRVLAEPEKYIDRDKNLVETLVKLLDGGKKLFVITNSDWSYTNAVMTYLLDGLHADFPSWRDYFEHIIVSAGKPNFFTGSNPFYEVVTEKEGLLKMHRGSFLPKQVYHGGNAILFERLTQQKGDQILYCGDHIYGDIQRSKELFNWRTLLVVQELEDQLSRQEKLQPDFERIMETIHQEEELQDEAQSLRSEIGNLQRRQKMVGSDKQKEIKQQQRLKEYIDQLQRKEMQLEEIHKQIKLQIEQREKALHPIWGELMRTSLEKSRFAKQIESYACLYTSRVTNLRFYSCSQKYRSYRDMMPHDM